MNDKNISPGSDSSEQGIVNQGFTVEFSSEEEEENSASGAGVDTRKAAEGKATPHIKASRFTESTAVVKPTSANFYDVGESKKDGELVEDATRHDEKIKQQQQQQQQRQPPDRTHQASSPIVVQNNKSNSGKQSVHSSSSSSPSNILPVPSMVGKERVVSSVSSQLANGNFAQDFAGGGGGEIKNPSSLIDSSNSFKKDGNLSSKEYFRNIPVDVVARSISNSLPFHINNNNLTNYGHNEEENSGQDSYCDTCRKRVLANYKIVFKYVFERPLFCFSLWAILYIFWGETALPGGSLFAITVLEITALILGFVAEVLQLPGLIGMTVAGLILRNVPYIDVAKDLDFGLSSALRGTSIVILLVRGGFSVDLVNIVKFKNIVPSLVIGSCVLEAVAATVAVYFIVGFPFEWAALVGCIISAMSGVAVSPYLTMTEKYLSSKAEQFPFSPNQKKVITVAKTACGLDAILAICMAEVALGFIFAEGDVRGGVEKGIAEILLGGVFGILWGSLGGIILDETSSNEKRVATVLASGVMSLIGLGKIGFPRGGPLATFSGALIVNTIWKKKGIGDHNIKQLHASFTMIWFVFQPLLFAIIGSRVDLKVVNWDIVTKGLLCLAISLIVRFIASFCMSAYGNLLIKERIYLGLAWMIKGTVQAALGPVALETALGLNNLKSPTSYENLGYQVMNISVATILVAATLGSVALRLIGPRLFCQKK